MSNYKKLTYDVLLHCWGHPLAIEVLSSSLFCRNVLQWRTALAKFKNNKSKDITNVLRISFDELEDIEKDIFLDIVCFFPICGEQYAKKILDFRGFHHEYGLQILVDISLICMKKGIIHMHSLLSNLGRCIVREKSPKEPRKWSRLWDYKDFHNVMSNNMVFEYKILSCYFSRICNTSKELIFSFPFAISKEAENLEAIVVRSPHKFAQTMRVDAQTCYLAK